MSLLSRNSCIDSRKEKDSTLKSWYFVVHRVLLKYLLNVMTMTFAKLGLLTKGMRIEPRVESRLESSGVMLRLEIHSWKRSNKETSRKKDVYFYFLFHRIYCIQLAILFYLFLKQTCRIKQMFVTVQLHQFVVIIYIKEK